MEEYNKWLQCPEIQELTETEPCSLEEEFSYQKEWETDNQTTSNHFIPQNLYLSLELIKLIRHKNSDSLIGDINLFFQDESIEINMMIAGKTLR